MNIHSIKFKIIFWYTGILLLLFGIILGGAFAASEYYGESNVKEELRDELEDLQEDIMRYPFYFPEKDLISYYDDGVMLSIYDENFRFINGVVPDDFPENVGFEENNMRKIKMAEENWFLNDNKIEMRDGTIIWIRGIHSYNAIVWMAERMISLVSIFFPLLLFVTIFVGFRMIQRSLRPLQSIMNTANEIASSGDITGQLALPKVKDEFYDLTVTFNRMFDVLHENFCRERQFSSDAAHELRTPVSVLLSHCEYCLEELELSAPVREELELIHKKTLQMSDLVSELLALSRTEKKSFQLDLEEVNLPMLAESVAEELEEKASEKGIKIEVVSYMKNPCIIADMGMIVRMFINMIENGINYGVENGFQKIQMYEKGEWIYICFKDNGIGIPEEALGKIWDRFYQVDSSHASSSGFGLGLSMVKRIVECHEGKIKAESTVGEGTVFTVLLPRKNQKNAE